MEIYLILMLTIGFFSILLCVYSIYHTIKYHKYFDTLKKESVFSKKEITIKDVMLNKKYAPKFRGSVRLSNSQIFTDKQIKEKRKQVYTKLP